MNVLLHLENCFFLASCQNAFASDKTIDFVFNCAGEIKSGQTDPVYREGIYKLSINCAQQAVNIGVKHFVEISSGNMNSSEKVDKKIYILFIIFIYNFYGFIFYLGTAQRG